MPIYEYQCHACGARHEVLQKMSDEPLTDCPDCHKSALEKLISRPAGFDLKGDGWYVTDFKNSGSANNAAKTTDAKSTESAKSEPTASEPVKADSKPAETVKTEAASTAAVKESNNKE